MCDNNTRCCSDHSNEYWTKFIATNTITKSKTEKDFGLSRIAKLFGKEESLQLYWEGANLETNGDVDGAISLYKRAFRIWPSLDSVIHGGLPMAVREDVIAAGLDIQLIDIIDVSKARNSRVSYASKLLSIADIEEVEAIKRNIVSESALCNNPQNSNHIFKVATFLNNPPEYIICNQSPQIIGKLLQFAIQAWNDCKWSGEINNPGPLYEVTGGVPSLSIRVIEHWEYEVGGGLSDPFHYDVDSVVTVVALLSEDFQGGIFRTNESDNSQMEHTMTQGDAVCFVSHKYHNITPVTQGIRRSLVMELWQGGVGHIGRE